MQFSEYMHKWLYEDGGYYQKHKDIGKKGDFYTAVSTSMFFGGSIAKKLLSTIEEGFLPCDTTIIEVGAHKGYLLVDIIQFIYTLKPELLEKLTFIIVEPFEQNQKAQLSYLKDSFGDAVKLLHVKSLEKLTCKSAFIVANEIFDAFTCEVIYDDKMLSMDNHEAKFLPINNKTKQIATKYKISKGEVALGYEEFAKNMCKHIEKFEFVTFDYGDRHSRGDFSLRVYANHKVYPFFALTNLIVKEELKENVKLDKLFANSDITYDVNFSHLIGAYKQAGASLHKYSSQMNALVDFGIIELLELLKNNSNQESYNAELNRVKPLIDPSFMGERFKMACFRKES